MADFSLKLPGFGNLQFSPEIEVDGKVVVPRSWKAVAGKTGVFRASDRLGSWLFQIREKAGEGGFEVFLEGRLRSKAKCVALRPVVLEPFAADHLVRHGRKMGSCKATLLPGNETFESHFLAAVTRGATTLQISHPLLQSQISTISGEVFARRIKRLAASTLFEPCHRGLLRAAVVTISSSSAGHDQMVNWAEAQITSRELRTAPQESGWNSWDYYRWTITEDEVYRNAEFIAADPVLSKHIKRIIVDDGWQYCYGEWEPNAFFPSGMKKLAKNLSRMGFEPGLWFAPTIAEPHSRLAQLEPDTLAIGVAGFPALAFSCMERKGFILDPTHPRVRAWWHELFSRYAKYGYRYFKLDFMAWTVRARRFSEPGMSPGQLMRRIVEPIRQAVGPDRRILGCNFNFEGGPGLVDDVRISSDIHANWNSVKSNVASIAVRFWSHRRWWINDPDFTVCRGVDTSDDPNLHQLKPCLPFVRPDDPNPGKIDYLSSLVELSKSEAEVLLSLVITSGGAMNLSDNLPRLNATGLQLLRKAVSAEKGNAAIPLDLFRSEYPASWVQRLDSGLHRILLINWKDGPASLSLDLASLNIPHRNPKNFWSGESVKVKRGKLSLRLAPHSCLLVESTL
ncbi:hypothetical protein BH09VER1_BH09VER1_08030 [soil metagenome]